MAYCMHKNVVRVIRYVQFQFHLVNTKMAHLLASSNDKLIISLFDRGYLVWMFFFVAKLDLITVLTPWEMNCWSSFMFFFLHVFIYNRSSYIPSNIFVTLYCSFNDNPDERVYGSHLWLFFFSLLHQLMWSWSPDTAKQVTVIITSYR